MAQVGLKQQIFQVYQVIMTVVVQEQIALPLYFLEDTIPANISYEWNGSAWTSTPSLNQGRSAHSGSGTRKAISAGGGAGGGSTNYANTETWNGSLGLKLEI